MMRSRQQQRQCTRSRAAASQSLLTWHPSPLTHHAPASISASARGTHQRSQLSALGSTAEQVLNNQAAVSTRRDALVCTLLAAGASFLQAPAALAAAAEAPDGFFTYVPIGPKTPAIRAGLIREPFYSMIVPSKWKEAKIANILSGNFCMPSCGEPWTEVVFESPSEGKLQLLVSPLVKLTNKKNLPIQELGTPESILPRIGGYITGTFMEDEDLVTFSSKVQDDGLTYYYYELYAPAANGHTLTAVTTKGDNCYLFVTSAPDKAWKSSEPVLRQAVEAFRA